MKHIRALTYVIEHELTTKEKLKKDIGLLELRLDSPSSESVKSHLKDNLEYMKGKLAIHSNRIEYMRDMLADYIEF